MIRRIADSDIETNPDEPDDGEGEVLALARRSIHLLDEMRQGLVEG